MPDKPTSSKKYGIIGNPSEGARADFGVIFFDAKGSSILQQARTTTIHHDSSRAKILQQPLVHNINRSASANSRATGLLSRLPYSFPTAMATPNVSSFSTVRARSYVFRLPLFTRAIMLVMALFWLLELQSVWDIKEWGALIPDKTGITTC